MAAKLASLATHATRAAAALGATIDEGARADLETWLARLEEWNARMDLTAARTAEELVDLMLADALILAQSPAMPQAGHLVDVGAGAGAPGLALAIVRRDLRVTLVEPLGKRASFLRTVIGEIGRTDVAIERARGEALTLRSPWEIAVSRATLRPAAWLDLGTRLVGPGGVVWVLLATEEAPTHARATLESEVAYAWPLTGARRRALAYRVSG
jgi:16S rRNA (guanine527-N7)-methyltransferase